VLVNYKGWQGNGKQVGCVYCVKAVKNNSVWHIFVIAERLKVCYSTKHMSQTYQPKKKKRKTTHGFLVRSSSPTGKNVLKRRRQKGRAKLAV